MLGTVSVIQMVVFSLLLSFAFSLKYTLREQKAADLGTHASGSGGGGGGGGGGGANDNHFDLEMSVRSNANQSSSFSSNLLLLSPGNSTRGLSTTRASAGVPVEMIKFWDVLLCHTISDESFTFATSQSKGSSMSNAGSSKSDDIVSLATSSRGADLDVRERG